MLATLAMSVAQFYQRLAVRIFRVVLINAFLAVVSIFWGWCFSLQPSRWFSVASFALAGCELTAKWASSEGSSITSVDPPQTQLSRLIPETERRDVDANISICVMCYRTATNLAAPIYFSNKCFVSKTCIFCARNIRWSISLMCWIVIANEPLTLGYFLCFDITNFPPFLFEKYHF